MILAEHQGPWASCFVSLSNIHQLQILVLLLISQLGFNYLLNVFVYVLHVHVIDLSNTSHAQWTRVNIGLFTSEPR